MCYDHMKNWSSYNQKIWYLVNCKFQDNKIDYVIYQKFNNVSVYDIIRDKLFEIT